MRRIALLLLLPVLFGALAACGGDDESPEDTTNGDTSDTAENGDATGEAGDATGEPDGDETGTTESGDGAASNPTPSPDLFDMEAAETTDSGLMYIQETEGDGAAAEPTSNVVVHYTGMLTDGTEFDSSHSRGEPTAFNLGQVIPGFAEGIVGMSEGGERTLYIPSDLAYGEQGNGPIPPGADLVFQVELIEVSSSQQGGGETPSEGESNNGTAESGE